jgi:hypothetical protein
MMSSFVLTLLDTTRIQPYIFASNRLQEIIGASHLVEQATQGWVSDLLERLFPGRHNVNPKTCERVAAQPIEESGSPLQVELIYAGGGNTALLFRDGEDARRFVRSLTARALQEAPGLQLLAVHQDVELGPASAESLGAHVTHLLEQVMAAKKLGRLGPQPSLGFGVTRACESTGLPASQVEPNPPQPLAARRVSQAVFAKLQATHRANERLHELLGRELQDVYRFPLELDNLGRFYGDESYIAVVHADGNGMGARIRQIAEENPDSRTYIEAMRSFSDSVKAAGVGALKKVIEALARMNPELLQPKNSWLPLRPLIFGGDDVTFVCRGDLGVALAALYLKSLEEFSLKAVEPAQIRACAGVSIVKLHYPFARAYHLAEELLKSAKKAVREEWDGDSSALDWHFTSAGLSGDLQTIRKAEYAIPKGDLYLRPLRLFPADYDLDGRAWYGRVEPLTSHFRREWSAARNKVKALHQALRADTVAEFLRDYELPRLPELIPGSEKYTETGWHDRCGYFDALELMDHYQSVGVEPEKEAVR